MSGPHALQDANRHVYAALDRLFAERGLGDRALFLNWGYAPGLAGWRDQAERPVPSGVPQQLQWRLVLEALAGVPIDGRDVLDIGCGRGGALDVITRQFAPRTLAGLDLSPANIAHCRRLHDRAPVRLQVGDACNLPYRDRSVDVLLTIESGSGYPDFTAFVRHVARVLRPGGVFVYVDLVPADSGGELHRLLAAMGLVVTLDRDVTANVLAARRENEHTEASLFGGGADNSELASFLKAYRAGPGSGLFQAMEAGRIGYRIVHARRDGPMAAIPATPGLDARHAHLEALSRAER